MLLRDPPYSTCYWLALLVCILYLSQTANSHSRSVTDAFETELLPLFLSLSLSLSVHVCLFLSLALSSPPLSKLASPHFSQRHASCYCYLLWCSPDVLRFIFVHTKRGGGHRVSDHAGLSGSVGLSLPLCCCCFTSLGAPCLVREAFWPEAMGKLRQVLGPEMPPRICS